MREITSYRQERYSVTDIAEQNNNTYIRKITSKRQEGYPVTDIAELSTAGKVDRKSGTSERLLK